MEAIGDGTLIDNAKTYLAVAMLVCIFIPAVRGWLFSITDGWLKAATSWLPKS